GRVVVGLGVASARGGDGRELIRNRNPCRVGREWAAPQAGFATAASPRSIAVQNPPPVTPASHRRESGQNERPSGTKGRKAWRVQNRKKMNGFKLGTGVRIRR